MRTSVYSCAVIYRQCLGSDRQYPRHGGANGQIQAGTVALHRPSSKGRSRDGAKDGGFDFKPCSRFLHSLVKPNPTNRSKLDSNHRHNTLETKVKKGYTKIQKLG